MNSRNWSESLLHRFRGRVGVPACDTEGNFIAPTIATMEYKKTSSGSTDAKNAADAQQELLPLVRASSSKDRSSVPRQIFRDFLSRWNRLTFRTRRFIILCVLPLIVLYTGAEVIDMIFPLYGVEPAPKTNQSTLSLEVSNTNEFVVVVNTYQRPIQLKNAIRHYADTCGPSIGIHTVYVIWAEEAVSPPTPEIFFQVEETRKRSTIKVLPVQNSLNSRFLPIPDVRDMAVFMVDDDIQVDCQSLKRGFEAWKTNPMSMVGYYPRLSLIDRSDKSKYMSAPPTSFIYHAWPIVYWRQKLNVILTKACFLHSQYMKKYSDPKQHPIEVLKYVDRYFNCEDVAMSLLVANTTRLSSNQLPARPIYVEGNVRDKGLFNGISTGSGHMVQRSKCLMDITAIYKRHGWEIPLDQTFSLRRSSWRQHRFWWQSRPSNIFEWFAIHNILK